jgi:hypothetical protein
MIANLLILKEVSAGLIRAFSKHFHQVAEDPLGGQLETPQVGVEAILQA